MYELYQNRKLSGALIMTLSYVITCDIGINPIHKYNVYIYPDQKNANIVCVMSCCVNKL